MIVLLLDSERDSGEVTCMPEELDVANEIEIEEKDSLVTEEDRRRTPMGGENILPVWEKWHGLRLPAAPRH